MTGNISELKRRTVEHFGAHFKREEVERVSDLAAPKIERASKEVPRRNEVRRLRTEVEDEYERRYGALDPATLLLILRLIIWMLGQWMDDGDPDEVADAGETR